VKGKSSTHKFGNPRAESMRLRSLYRGRVLRGELKVESPNGLRAMRALVGPDCAYHLYRGFKVEDKS